MHRIRQVLGALALTASMMATTACASDQTDPSPSAEVGSTTSERMTTTKLAPVPGVDGGLVDLPAAVVQRWNDLGGPSGVLGAAVGPATDVAGGSITDFESGAIVLDPEGRPFVVQGEILSAYRDAGGPTGELGYPTSDEATTDGGWISTFEGGAITFLDGKVVIEGVAAG